MNPDSLKRLLLDVQKKRISIESAVQRLRSMPFQDLGFAKVDTHRNLRKGFPEVVYCEGKDIDHIKRIFKELARHKENILATRASPQVYRAIKKDFKKVQYHRDSRIITFIQRKVQKKGLVVIVCAGTSDIPIAEEACITCELLGANIKRLYDVGVAGIHRLLVHIELLQRANCIVVVAGMEGALPSVVGGLVDKPVIAVPTSVGYGASFNGVAPLLTMLNSCASGVVVVNIDNGFGAGYTAGLINRLAEGGST